MFIDYGNEERIPLRFVLKMPESLYQLPCQVSGGRSFFGCGYTRGVVIYRLSSVSWLESNQCMKDGDQMLFRSLMN